MEFMGKLGPASHALRSITHVGRQAGGQASTHLIC